MNFIDMSNLVNQVNIQLGDFCNEFLEKHKQLADLTDNGNEILATTSRGLYVSKNEDRSWSRR